ncbi:MAG: YjgP/YjgQ family permease [Armatimonadetes bacterium]|nr:YjgP/YjgQ family permease [Armatimonadota bacterium]NCP31424.1 YjgP/YjgQ family permease [Armatimonadota bacterium]NDK14274.1 YjgP/YjgQ family permease [Armatimonadota bacterium]
MCANTNQPPGLPLPPVVLSIARECFGYNATWRFVSSAGRQPQRGDSSLWAAQRAPSAPESSPFYPPAMRVIPLANRMDRYLAAEMLVPFVIGVLACIAIMLGDILYKTVSMVINRGLPPVPLALFLLYKVPAVAVSAFGAAVLLSTSLVVNRLVRDCEIVAFRVSGVSLHRLFLPIFLFAIGVSGIAYWVNQELAPEMNHKSEEIVRRLLYAQPVPLIENDKYFRASGDYYFYVREVDRSTDTLRDVMLYQRENGSNGYPRLVLAKRAQQRHGAWTLIDCVVYKFGPNGLLRYQGKASSVTLNLRDAIETFFGEQRTPFEMPVKDLEKEIQVFRRGGMDVTEMEMEYHRKLAVPLASLVLALVAAPLSMRWAPAGSFVGLLLTVVLYFLWNGSMSWSCALGGGRHLPPLVAAWAPNCVFAFIGLLLLLRER